MNQIKDTRAVTRISSCRVNTTSRRGIKQLGISFGSFFCLFSFVSSWGATIIVAGGNPWPPAVYDTPGYTVNIYHYPLIVVTYVYKGIQSLSSSCSKKGISFCHICQAYLLVKKVQ